MHRVPATCGTPRDATAATSAGPGATSPLTSGPRRRSFSAYAKANGSGALEPLAFAAEYADANLPGKPVRFFEGSFGGQPGVLMTTGDGLSEAPDLADGAGRVPPGMERLRITLPVSAALAALIALVAVASASASESAATARAGGNFVKHSGPNWVWFGPRSWEAAYGTYGLSIFGDDGESVDYGGSTTLCAGTPAKWFDGRRRAFASLPGLSQVKFRKISRIRTNRPFNRGGTASQTMKFSARANGKKIGGELGFQYALYVFDQQYCYQAQLYKAAIDDRDFKQSMKTVNEVWDRTAYSGPGLPINPNTGLP